MLWVTWEAQATFHHKVAMLVVRQEEVSQGKEAVSMISDASLQRVPAHNSCTTTAIARLSIPDLLQMHQRVQEVQAEGDQVQLGAVVEVRREIILIDERYYGEWLHSCVVSSIP